MATVYSLVCFGGLSGKTVTFTDAGDVVNLTNHGLRQGVTGIVFSTTGSLPTGITAGTTYYPRDGADASKFTIYPTAEDAIAGTNQVTFTGTGSGTHTVKSAYMLGLTSAQLSRYGSSGTERIYDGIMAWNTAMAARATDADVEYCEIGEVFTEIVSGTSYLVISTLIGAGFVWTKVNGERSAAFHNGVIGSGYIFKTNSGSYSVSVSAPYFTIDGFEVQNIGSSGGLALQQVLSTFSSMISVGKGIGTGLGIWATVPSCNVLNCISLGWGEGIRLNSYNNYARIANNLFCKNTTGVYFNQTTNIFGTLLNNISVGNTTNYGRQSLPNRANNNVGEVADKQAVTVDASTDIFTLAAHAITSGARVVFTTSGTLPAPLSVGTVYYARDITTDTFKIAATYGGAAINITDTGTGTYYISRVWDTNGSAIHIDLADKASIWVDYDNNDFRLVSGSPLINAGTDYFGADPIDIADNIRPNYQPSVYPNEVWDVGPYEYDHGYGDAPETLTISNLTTGTRVIATRADTGAALGTAVESGGSVTISIGYSGTVNIEARNASGTPAYKPWTTQISFPGTKSVIALQEVD